MIVCKHISLWMPYVVALPAETSSFDLVTAIALTGGGYDPIRTFIDVIHGASVRYLKVSASTFGASLVGSPVFHV